MRGHGRIDVARSVLFVGWLLLAARMKSHLGWTEVAAGVVLFVGTVVVWFGD
jgi:hypothetical protein